MNSQLDEYIARCLQCIEVKTKGRLEVELILEAKNTPSAPLVHRAEGGETERGPDALRQQRLEEDHGVSPEAAPARSPAILPPRSGFVGGDISLRALLKCESLSSLIKTVMRRQCC